MNENLHAVGKKAMMNAKRLTKNAIMQVQEITIGKHKITNTGKTRITLGTKNHL